MAIVPGRLRWILSCARPRLSFIPATRTTTQVVRLPDGRLNTGLSVSPDGEWILFSRREQRSDLMMLEGVW